MRQAPHIYENYKAIYRTCLFKLIIIIGNDRNRVSLKKEGL